METTIKTNSSTFDWGMLVARIFLASVFAMSLWGKVTGFSGTASMIGNAGFPLPNLLLIGAIILELVGVVTLILGYRMDVGAAALIIFTLAANFMFHLGLGPDTLLLLNSAFLKNLGLIGGLLLLFALTPGRLSLAHYLAPKKTSSKKKK